MTSFLQVQIDPLNDLYFYQFFELVVRVSADQQNDFDVCVVGWVERLAFLVLEAVFHLYHLGKWEVCELVEDVLGLGGSVGDDRPA